MKRLLSIVTLSFLIFFSVSNGILAKSHDYKTTPKNFITFSWFLKPASLGLKHRLFSTIYITGNIDYRSTANDLEFQTGAVYLIPREFLIFRLYAGGGYQFSRNEGYQYPYLTVGTNFIFFFSEAVYPMESGLSPKYRFGLSFKF